MASASKLLSYSDVSVHNTSEDCWVIINSKVYNVTNFLSEHPGGDEVLLESAGKDASEEFEDVGHGSAARLMLDEFYVGEVDPSNHETKSKATGAASSGSVTATKDKPLESTNNRLLYFVVAFAIIILGMGVNVFRPSS
ncbi:cytochrome b5-like [Primulina eburnea]|uniref:cytochrome b5-like n=1 Tax=Primulina eburnea TaxID=1245227 RepID=UPI003C6C7CC8